MEDSTLVNEPWVVSKRLVIPDCGDTVSSPGRRINRSVVEEITRSGGKDLKLYIKKLKLLNDPNILVLSSTRHYYYDQSELKCITTLINLKKLNQIENIDSFLDTLYNIFSPGVNFIGFFSDYNIEYRSRLISRMYNGFINFLDSRLDIYFDREVVTEILESHGFQVIDMRLINGLTYFSSRKSRSTDI